MARGERQPEERPLTEVDAEAEQLADFAAAVRGEKPPEVGGAEGLAVVAVLQAAVESVATGTVVEVEGPEANGRIR